MLQNHMRLVVLVCIAVAMSIVVVLRLTGSGRADLVEQLRSGSSEERIEAIHGLEKVGSGAAADAIASAVGDSDTQVACRAVRALGHMPSPQLTNIKAAARDKRPEVREAAATAMGYLGDDADADELIQVVTNKGENENVRAAAARSLGRLDVFAAMPTLVEALDDPSPLVRARAQAAILRIIQIDLGFRADDPPAKRRLAVEKIRNFYPRMEKKHAHLKRCIRARRKSK